MKGRAKGQNSIEYYMKLPYSILLHETEDEGQKFWIAEIPELPGCKSHGITIEAAVASVEEAKKEWILDSLEDGEEVPTPIERDKFSGRTLLRMSRSLHRALSLIAETEKLSLNQLIVTILAKEVGRLGVLNRVEKKLDNLLEILEKDIEQKEQTLILNADISSGFVGSIYPKYQWQALAGTNLRRRISTAEEAGEIHAVSAIPRVVDTTSNFGNILINDFEESEKGYLLKYVNPVLPAKEK